jgi:hypothetical protein
VTMPSNPRAVRLTFSRDGNDVTLLSQQTVEMTVAPSDTTENIANHKGFWYELRDAQQKLLYRRVMHLPVAESKEVFGPPGLDHSISRVPISQPKGTFSVVVPDVDRGHTVVLMSSPSDPAQRTRPAAEMGRFAVLKTK